MSNSALRLLTALIGIPTIVGMLYLGDWPFTLLVLVLALLAQLEVYQLLEAAGQRPNRVLGLLLGALLVLRAVHPPLLFAAAAVTVAVVAWSPLQQRSAGSLPPGDAAEAPIGASSAGAAMLPATLFGAVYPSSLLAFLLDLRAARGPGVADLDAFFLTLAVFVLVWSADTAAYYVGRSLGKRPLAPAASPKKTWEGAIGGVVGALAAAIALKLLVLDVLPWLHAGAIGLIAGILGPLGDLAESTMKRHVGVKESGSLLPGHGGMLDRFDAMTLVAPAAYLYLRFVAGIFP